MHPKLSISSHKHATMSFSQDDGPPRDLPSLRLLSLNVWWVAIIHPCLTLHDVCFRGSCSHARGLKFVSAKRKERIRAIADYICQSAQPESPTAASTNSGEADNLPLSTSYSTHHRQQQDGTTNGHADSVNASGSRWDIVCLQELWCSEDWDYVQARCKHSGSGLIHGRYFYR